MALMRIEHRLFGHMATSALADCTMRAFIAMEYNGILWPPHMCLPNREMLTNCCHAYTFSHRCYILIWKVGTCPWAWYMHSGNCPPPKFQPPAVCSWRCQGSLRRYIYVSIPRTCLNHIINPHPEFPTSQKNSVLPWCRGWLGLVIWSSE